jgi:hypothetical protein
MAGDNGKQDVEQLTLQRDRATGVVSLTSNVPLSVDSMLNMLAQATRHLDTKFRIIMALEVQADMAQQKADKELAAKLMGNH